MKTILVPTDYSEVANNSTRYAVELAKELDAKLILFHAYHRRILLSSLPLLFDDSGLEKFNIDRLKAEEFNIKKTCCDSVQTETVVYKGRNAVNGILDTINERNIDYIVMGVTGSSILPEVLIGSNTLSVIDKTKIPVFVIPKEAKFKKIKKIVFIHNYNEPTPINVSQELKMFCEKFNAELIVYGKPELQEVENFEKIKSASETEFKKSGSTNVNHVLTLSEDEDQTEEINAFVELNKADIMAMMPNTSKSFTKIFQRDNTTKMAFHTNLPLLILHENPLYL